MYLQLHAFVRGKLSDRYGESEVPRDGPIPGHLLGNLWAHEWSDVDVLPFASWSPFMPERMAEEGMAARGYTPKVIFQKADDFFQSLGFPHLPKEFWEGSVMEKANISNMENCHPVAFDFFNGKDYRIRQCGKVTASNSLW